MLSAFRPKIIWQLRKNIRLDSHDAGVGVVLEGQIIEIPPCFSKRRERTNGSLPRKDGAPSRISALFRCLVVLQGVSPLQGLVFFYPYPGLTAWAT